MRLRFPERPKKRAPPPRRKETGPGARRKGLRAVVKRYSRKSSKARPATPARRLASLLRKKTLNESDRAEARRLQVRLGKLTPKSAIAQLKRKKKLTKKERADVARWVRLRRTELQKEKRRAQKEKASRQKEIALERRRAQQERRELQATLAKCEEALRRSVSRSQKVASQLRRARPFAEKARRSEGKVNRAEREVQKLEQELVRIAAQTRQLDEETIGRAREAERLEKEALRIEEEIARLERPIETLEQRYLRLREQASHLVPEPQIPLGVPTPIDSERWTGIKIVVPIRLPLREAEEIEYRVSQASLILLRSSLLPPRAFWITTFQFTAFGERLIGSGRVSQRVENDDFQTHGFDSTGAHPSREGMIFAVSGTLEELARQAMGDTFVLIEYATITATRSKTPIEVAAFRRAKKGLRS